MSDDLKDELRWMSQGTVNPRAAAQALERIAELEARAEAAEKELARWRSLQDAIAELNGHGPDWPDHGNAPLAIAAGYSLTKNRAEAAEAALAAARREGEQAGLERAAKVAEGLPDDDDPEFELGCRSAAAAIRAEKEAKP